MRRAILGASVLVVVVGLENLSSEGVQDARIRLIVRGDDFGVTHASNAGLEEAFRDGIMTSASVMAPAPWFLETAELVRAHPEWTVGLHLTLTSEWPRFRWKPVLPYDRVPTLVDGDGFFHPGGYYMEEIPEVRPPDPVEVEKELRAQIRLAQERGVRIDYLDCHMWVACSPQLRSILEALAREICVPVSLIGDLGEREIHYPGRRPWPLPPEEVRDGLIEMLRSLSPGLWLYVDHPARDSPESRAVDLGWAAHWEGVLEAWTDADVTRLIEGRGIELVSYRDLWDYERCRPK